MLRIFDTIEPPVLGTLSFGSAIDFAQVPPPFGGKKGAVLIAKILGVIGDTHPQLEYSPIIPAIVAILCTHMPPDDVLGCTTAMIDGHSVAASKTSDWAYFPVNRRDYLVFERVLDDLISTFAPRIHRHVMALREASMEPMLRGLDLTSDGRLNGKDTATLGQSRALGGRSGSSAPSLKPYAPPWGRLSTSLFVNILPVELIVRIFDCYLVQGYRTILSFAVAHLIVRQEALLATRDGASFDGVVFASADSGNVLGDNGQALVEAYFDVASTVKFNRALVDRLRNRRRRHSWSDAAEDELAATDRANFVFIPPFPKVHGRASDVLTTTHLVHLWEWIPARFRHFGLRQAFSSAHDGSHMLNVLERCAESEPLLLVIQTASGKVFGAYLSKALRRHPQPSAASHSSTPPAGEDGSLFYGSGETFLYSLAPSPAKYAWNSKSGSTAFIYVGVSFIAFGAGHDFGLTIDKHLERVSSGASVTFANAPLVDNAIAEDGAVHLVEVYAFTPS